MSRLLKSCTTLTANPDANKDISLNSMFHWASKTHQSISPFVHDSVSAFSASEWIPGFYFIFLCDILHRYIPLAAALGVGRPSGCPLLVPRSFQKCLAPRFQRLWLVLEFLQ